MNRIISIAFLIVGILMTIYGVSALDSVGSSFSRFFTGTPTDKTMWLIIGGVACASIGLMGIVRDSKS